jgi:3-hydroxybutyryl-CoA dehydratase
MTTVNLLSFDDVEIGRTHTLARTMTAADVDAFGHLSGDLNPLHMNEEFAARTPFKRRVVHGLLTGALVSTTHTQLTGPGFAYVGQELKFLGPVFIGDTLKVEVTVVGKKDAKRILILDTVVSKQNGDKVMAGLSALKELRFA